MSILADYQRETVELVGLKRKYGKAYLVMKLSLEQQVEIYWEIDHQTTEQLTGMLQFADSYKYRLSLQCMWDNIKRQYRGFITKTNDEKSERFSFLCSTDFNKQMKAVRRIKTADDLHSLSFLSFPPRKKVDKQIRINQSKAKDTMKWIAASLVIAFALLLFQYQRQATTFTLAGGHLVNASLHSNEHQVHSKEKTFTPEQIQIEDAPPLEIQLLEVDVDELITYDIPKGHVALTFDDGPSKYTKEMVEILNSYDVAATFFFVGSNVNQLPETVEYVHANGYPIGGHTVNHPELSKLAYEKQSNEILQSMNKLEEIVKEDVTLFRPPYGDMNDNTKKIIKENGMNIVMWSLDTRDWATKNPNTILQRVKQKEASGSIILMHESQTVVDILPQVIEYLQKQDLKFVSLR